MEDTSYFVKDAASPCGMKREYLSPSLETILRISLYVASRDFIFRASSAARN
jgi:hypothetical protein